MLKRASHTTEDVPELFSYSEVVKLMHLDLVSGIIILKVETILERTKSNILKQLTCKDLSSCSLENRRQLHHSSWKVILKGTVTNYLSVAQAVVRSTCTLEILVKSFLTTRIESSRIGYSGRLKTFMPGTSQLLGLVTIMWFRAAREKSDKPNKHKGRVHKTL